MRGPTRPLRRCHLSDAARREHARAHMVPTRGAQYGFLVTHNESISIARLLHGARRIRHRGLPATCHYAYHPADDAVLSLHEMFGRAAKMQEKHHILDENEIVDGIDELGVLLFGHDNNAYWYGSQLSIEEPQARALSERHRPAGDLRGARRHGVGAGKPERRHRRSRRDGFRPAAGIQLPYLGPVKGFYTDWTPLTDRPDCFRRYRYERSLAVPKFLVR